MLGEGFREELEQSYGKNGPPWSKGPSTKKKRALMAKKSGTKCLTWGAGIGKPFKSKG